jgi:hypothetical protein
MCRYCGESVPTNSLSTHIRRAHPRPAATNLSPTLVRKPAVTGTDKSRV